MFCPEGEKVPNEPLAKAEDVKSSKNSKTVPSDGSGSVELASYKNPKTWKKSISNFFRNQMRTTKSNDGDLPSDSTERFEAKEVTREQKWQSLGKVFKRQTFAEHWDKSSNQQGETSSHQSKRAAVRKVLSTYFGNGKNPKNELPEN